MSEPNPRPDACTCPRGDVSGGTLYGVRMSPLHDIRLRTKPGCPVHDPHTHGFVDPYPDGPPPWHVPPRLCASCGEAKRRHARVIPLDKTRP